MPFTLRRLLGLPVRWKVIVYSSVLAGVLIAGVLLFIDREIHSLTQDYTREELEWARLRVRDYQRARLEQLRLTSAELAASPELSSLLNRPKTLPAYLRRLVRGDGAELLLVADAESHILGRTVPETLTTTSPHLPSWTKGALQARQPEGILNIGGTAYAATALAAHLPGGKAVLIIGCIELGDKLASVLRTMTNDEIALVGDQLFASTLPNASVPWHSAEQWQTFVGAISQSGKAPEVNIGGVTYSATAARLSAQTADAPLAIVMVSRDRIMAPYLRIQRALMLIELLAGVAGVLFAAVIAHRATAPLKRVAEVTRRVTRGELDVDLPVEGSDEVADVARAFNSLIDGLRERARMEKFVSELQEQLRQSQKMEAVGRLAGGVAHDFNNLLTVISGQSEMLFERLNDVTDRSRANEIKQAADRAAALTRQLLAFSRKQILSPQVLDLNSVIANVTGMLQRLVGKNVNLVTRFDPDLGRVNADASQIEQVVVNLVVNARDAMPDGGSVFITTVNVSGLRHPLDNPATYDEVMLSVRDTGSGMDSNTQAHLFEPFFTTKDVGKGTGLGLATVHGIVQQSGGRITVESGPGEGSAFRIYLPRVNAPLSSAVQEAHEPIPDGNETILLVEDEHSVRALMREALEQRGYTVLEAVEPADALQMIENGDGLIQLLLTDLVMPGIDGRKLAEKAVAIYPDLRVLYVSGFTNDRAITAGLLGPTVGYLQKPFNADTLTRKVRQLLDTVQVIG